MSKDKHKRKSQRRQQQRQQRIQQTRLTHDEVVAPENDPPPAAAGDQKGYSKGKETMAFSEFLKRSSFTDWCLTIFTLALAASAIYQFVIMGSQLDVMQKDQRAWILISRKDASDPIMSANKPLGIMLTLTDTGKTPATNLFGTFIIEVVPNGQTPHFEGKNANYIAAVGYAVGTLLPGSPQEFYVHRDQFGRPGLAELLTDGEKESIDEGRAYVATHGILYYDDIFRVRHWIRFCVWSGTNPGTYTAAGCSAYNSIDQ